MATFRRCDSCRKEVEATMGFMNEDDWWHAYQVGGSTLTFCSDGCMTDYYVSKRMIEGAT